MDSTFKLIDDINKNHVHNLIFNIYNDINFNYFSKKYKYLFNDLNNPFYLYMCSMRYLLNKKINKCLYYVKLSSIKIKYLYVKPYVKYEKKIYDILQDREYRLLKNINFIDLIKIILKKNEIN